MLYFRFTFLISILIVFPVLARAEAEQIGKFKNWTIYFDRDDGEHCHSVAVYKDETIAGLEKSLVDGAWSFTFANNQWKSLQRGKTYEVTFIFNDRREWTDRIIGIENGFRGVRLKKPFLNEFAKSSVVEIRYRGKKVGRFSLLGSRNAISAVNDCYNNKIEQRDPFADKDDNFKKQIKLFKYASNQSSVKMSFFSEKLEEVGSILRMVKHGFVKSPYDCLPEFRNDCYDALNKLNQETTKQYVGDWGEWWDAIGNDEVQMKSFVAGHINGARKRGYHFFSNEERK